ncbi:cob(I)yrinic acid a,c-diamide adenosyltransferase [Thermoflavifilum thermophilum]|uniref:Corrinoid adenosyltransferase n=1 Tax=Thermoflavifilum thermophilum TaxID=1393122 RepID=A0A1I7NFR7_9BACT|nr:cob(I)yrinic acid a,c-diamide adenosyltransferase [Thermoflavifilum thermophilum]SFV33511.1 cob(I)alamin adenosyltransferase [Thermoflavifilum thermophilum]
MAFRIYTRTGDQGKTSLLGGTRVWKSDLRIEAYGTIDELNAYIGWLADEQPENIRNELREVQDRLFRIGAVLAYDGSSSLRLDLPEVSEADITTLEKAIDRMEADLPPLKQFILPGGHPAVSLCHVARCVCRRAERACVRLSQETPLPEHFIPYLNRLSDYLFVLARYTAQQKGVAEITWQPH